MRDTERCEYWKVRLVGILRMGKVGSSNRKDSKMEPTRVISSPQNFMVDRACVFTLLSTINPRERWEKNGGGGSNNKSLTKRKNNCKFKNW